MKQEQKLSVAQIDLRIQGNKHRMSQPSCRAAEHNALRKEIIELKAAKRELSKEA